MENKRTSGICAYCGEESDKLFTPPLLSPHWPNLEKAKRKGYWRWHVPGQAYPGTNLYYEVAVGGVAFLRGYETPNEPVCWQCFSGHLCPAEQQYVVNKPAEFSFDGWRDPIWKPNS